MSHIAVDIDDTLYDFNAAARAEVLRRGHDVAAYAHWGDWRMPHDLLGAKEWMSVIEAVHTDDSIIAQTPYDDAAETCQELIRRGHKLIYITTRAESCYGATHEWLTNNDFPVGGEDGRAKLVIPPGYGDKMPFLQGFEVLIDDRPKTAVQFAYTPSDRVRWAFMLMKPYNHNLTDVPNIFVSPTWYGIREGLARKGFLGPREQ